MKGMKVFAMEKNNERRNALEGASPSLLSELVARITQLEASEPFRGPAGRSSGSSDEASSRGCPAS